MSVDSVGWAAGGTWWCRFGGVGCGWGGVLDWQRGYYGWGDSFGLRLCVRVANAMV